MGLRNIENMRWLSVVIMLVSGTVVGQLNIEVHIWGEVKQPGAYMVPEGTNVLQLISRAGGPTQFADLGRVEVTHVVGDSNWMEFVNIGSYLKGRGNNTIPVLGKGDVVIVPTNAWYRWRRTLEVTRDLAIIINVAYWLTMISKMLK